ALLHTWARGRGAMPLVSFMFLRDLCIQIELYSLDRQSAYQHAFVFARQLGVILKGTLTERGAKKESSKSSKNKR
ncbi:hypothetical protein ACJX0J_032425, partial [Zea mays]